MDACSLMKVSQSSRLDLTGSGSVQGYAKVDPFCCPGEGTNFSPINEDPVQQQLFGSSGGVEGHCFFFQSDFACHGSEPGS